MNPLDPNTANQIQTNLITYFRLFAGLPGITFVEEDVTWIVTEKGAPGNHILRAQFAPAETERRIDETLAQIGQRTHQIDWYVFPNCQPADLGERVAARGMAGGPTGAWQLIGQIGGPGGYWLTSDLSALSSPPPLADGLAHRFHIEFVNSDALLETWRRVSAIGFGGDDCQAFYAAYSRHGYGSDAYSLHYIGYLDSEPVTSGTLLLAGGIAGLFDISTPPAHRRQGFGSLITWYMMQEAQQRGVREAYVWSSQMGQGVYRGVGFVPVALGMREYRWQKRAIS